MNKLFSILDAGNGKIVKLWNHGVPFEDAAIEQLKACAQLPFVHPYVAAMPDCHWGNGSTIGTVMPTKGAICPAAVGVDIGCGMTAMKLELKRASLTDEQVAAIYEGIKKAVPHGRTNDGGDGDRGAWHDIPARIHDAWVTQDFGDDYLELSEKHPGARSRNAERQLGTLGTGNHFIELSEDEEGYVWIVLHSGSRGLGNRIGTYFTKLAQQQCEVAKIDLPTKDLAYLLVGSESCNDYMKALFLAQDFARVNRDLMMGAVQEQVARALGLWMKEWPRVLDTIRCHHNYVSIEKHFDEALLITRKGAVDASFGKRGIIPGSMGARTYIVEGLGSKDSFHSCSHGAGRAMGRKAAIKAVTVEQHVAATSGVLCDKTADTLDETPAAYKDIEAVMAAQADLVKPLHTLKAFLCVKGGREK